MVISRSHHFFKGFALIIIFKEAEEEGGPQSRVAKMGMQQFWHSFHLPPWGICPRDTPHMPLGFMGSNLLGCNTQTWNCPPLGPLSTFPMLFLETWLKKQAHCGKLAALLGTALAFEILFELGWPPLHSGLQCCIDSCNGMRRTDGFVFSPLLNDY